MANRKLEAMRGKYKLQLGKNRPIEYKGFRLLPIPMEHIYLFQAVKPSLCVGTDHAFGHLPYLTMLYHLDGEQMGERLSALLVLLAMALGTLNAETLDTGIFAVLDGDRIKLYAGDQPITEAAFRNMRLIIALQNDIEIPDETENPTFRADLIAEHAGEPLDLDMDHLIDWFCAKQRTRRDLLFAEYTIREFFMQTRALETDLLFHVYNMPGWDFKDKRNPYPHWAFPRQNDNPYGIVPVRDFDPKAEIRTVDPGSLPKTEVRGITRTGKLSNKGAFNNEQDYELWHLPTAPAFQ